MCVSAKDRVHGVYVESLGRSTDNIGNRTIKKNTLLVDTIYNCDWFRAEHSGYGEQSVQRTCKIYTHTHIQNRAHARKRIAHIEVRCSTR